MERFLGATEVVDHFHPEIRRLAAVLAAGKRDPVSIASECFRWVRDETRHTRDYGLETVTCTASEVLRTRTGYCYAKSHLLAALLRANGIPSGFCYQRLSRDGGGPPFCLHGLTAVFFPDTGWYRMDARGNKPGVNAGFNPPVEQLAFVPKLSGETDFLRVLEDPLPVVIEALRTYGTSEELFHHLPDLDLSKHPTGAPVVAHGGTSC